MKLNHKYTKGNVPMGLLRIDHSYQQPLVASRVAMIVAAFDPDALGPLLVSKRSNGLYFIFDGQHRFAALCELFKDWKNQAIPCLIYTDLSPKDEAGMFYFINGKRKAVTAFSLFRARMRAQEEVAIGISKIVHATGFPLTDTLGESLQCVAVLERIYRGFRTKNALHGPDILHRALQVAASAWGTKEPFPYGEVFAGLGLLVDRYGETIDYDVLTQKLSVSPGGPSLLVGNARGLRPSIGGTVAGAIAEVMRGTYNRGRRSRQLPPFHEGKTR